MFDRLARPGAAAVSLTLTLFLAACGTGSAPTATSPVPTPTQAPSSSPSAVATPVPPTASPQGSIRLVSVASGFESPVAVVNAGDGSDRLFVVEQPGRIRIVRDGVVVATPFLDIDPRIASGDERGLLGLAFAPDFPKDPRLFVDYTDVNGNTVVSSFTVPAATPDRADPASERVLLQFEQPFENHNGGGLAFGPDGDLYISAGDGGSGGDPMGNGQNLETLLGKLLRIRPGAADGSGPAYTIPKDAPYASDPKARPEIRASGLRNPWRFSFDRKTGDLWIGDVGQDSWEEVDVIRAGDAPKVAPDFGWNVMEGRHCFGADACDQQGLTLPVAEYNHNGGNCAIIGGYVVRATDQPTLKGRYLFGDPCSGDISALDAVHPEASQPTVLLETGPTISSFGEDEAGHVYLTDSTAGSLFRIEPLP